MVKNIDNWHEYLWYKFGLRRKDPLIFYCKNNVVVEVPVRLMQTFKEIFFDECYTRLVPKGILTGVVTVVDIGANAGYFSLYMLSRCRGSQVIAFEPMPNNFALLRRNRERNATHNLAIENKAVYGRPGKIILRYNAADSFTTAGSVFENELGNDEIEVEAITLDQVFKGYALETIDFLKLDCEGSEYRILYDSPGDCLRRIKCIALESHQGKREDENRATVCEFLVSTGYKCREDGGGILWAWREGRG